MVKERVQRRLAAILVADVVSYSRLMGENEAGTRARFNSHLHELIEPAIANRQGRTVKTTGDGLLVEFASVVDAVECAVEIQKGLADRNADEPADRRMEFRIGINLGDVIIEGDDIHGDGVNVAARLEGLAEPGGIVVSGTVREHVRGKLDVGFDDLGLQQVKNIVEPVRAYRADAAVSDSVGGSEKAFRRPSIAVLPFANLSRDLDQEYFADGLTEDIITALSAFHAVPVIARNSTFAYKGQSPDVRKVAADLDVRYVLEGSVRRGGDQLRIVSQLIDATTGHHVWAETFDRAMEDIFAIQDEITQRVAAAVEPEIQRAERTRLVTQRPASLDAWGCYQRGMACLDERTREGNARARELCERAVALDPTYCQAHIGLAFVYYRDILWRFAEAPVHTRERMFEAARRAPALDDLDAGAHWVMGLAHHNAGQYGLAIAEGRRALELNPNFALGYVGLGVSLFLAGHWVESAANLGKAIQINPRDSWSHMYVTILARACLNSGAYEQAAMWARRAITYRADFVDAHLVLASSLAHAGRTAEARPVLAECERLAPGSTKTGTANFDIRTLGGGTDTDPDRFGHALLLDGLRKSGKPE